MTRRIAGAPWRRNEMQVAILAGGIGTRLGGLTQDRPKSMVQILKKPFLEYQLELLKKQEVEGQI